MEFMGELRLGELPRIWQRLDEVHRRVNGLRSAHETDVLTTRRMDEVQPAGTRGLHG
jgi:hypothetical protein